MPVYNAEKYIAEAIYSILGQTFQHFELLIIDDSSTDRSIEIIQSFYDPRIQLYQNEKNEGITASLNKGIALSKCELIARMDADDICHPLRLEKQVAYMQENQDYAMVSSWVRLIDEKGNYIKTEGTKSKYLYYNLFFECCIFHPTVMFRKELLAKIGNYLLAYAEDLELFQRISKHFRIGGIDEPLLDYRIHDANTNTVKRKEEYDDFSLKVLQDNLANCLGNNKLPIEYLECYRYNYDLLKKKNVAGIYNCLKLLDTISICILDTSNPNNCKEDINFMWQFKKSFIVRDLAKRLPIKQKILLLWKYDRKTLLSVHKMKISLINQIKRILPIGSYS